MINKTSKHCYVKHRRSSFLGRIALLVLLTFSSSEIFPAQFISSKAYAQTILDLPVPGTMVEFTPPSTPPLLIGLKIHPENPMKFDFLLDRGDVKKLDGDELKNESTRLIKYFLAALTVPAKDVWVNLSPYEKDRIVSEQFGLTEMGRDLLGQDYLLKQLMASLTYPEEGLGKTFWDRVYKKAFDLYGTTNIPLNTFNKVWIVPESSRIFEQNDTAFIVNSHLKVMLEEDYLALKENMTNQKLGTEKLSTEKVKKISNISSGVVKEVLLPEIEREVNEGKNFALLRQIFHSLILAVWYKKKMRDSLLGQVYVDKNKVKGVDASDPNVKEKIYQQYIDAFRQGVYNYIREDYDPYMQKNIPRKYFSGGFEETKEFEQSGGNPTIDAAALSGPERTRLDQEKQEIGDGEIPLIKIQVAELGERKIPMNVQIALNADGPAVKKLRELLEKIFGAEHVVNGMMELEIVFDFSRVNGNFREVLMNQFAARILEKAGEMDATQKQELNNLLQAGAFEFFLNDEDVRFLSISDFQKAINAGKPLFVVPAVGGGADEKETLFREDMQRKLSLADLALNGNKFDEARSLLDEVERNEEKLGGAEKNRLQKLKFRYWERKLRLAGLALDGNKFDEARSLLDEVERNQEQLGEIEKEKLRKLTESYKIKTETRKQKVLDQLEGPWRIAMAAGNLKVAETILMEVEKYMSNFNDGERAVLNDRWDTFKRAKATATQEGITSLWEDFSKRMQAKDWDGAKRILDRIETEAKQGGVYSQVEEDLNISLDSLRKAQAAAVEERIAGLWRTFGEQMQTGDLDGANRTLNRIETEAKQGGVYSQVEKSLGASRDDVNARIEERERERNWEAFFYKLVKEGRLEEAKDFLDGVKQKPDTNKELLLKAERKLEFELRKRELIGWSERFNAALARGNIDEARKILSLVQSFVQDFQRDFPPGKNFNILFSNAKQRLSQATQQVEARILKRDYYEVLGVPRNAPDQDVINAYRKLAFAKHPDRNPSSTAALEMMAINDAGEALNDSQHREYRDLYNEYGFNWKRYRQRATVVQAGIINWLREKKQSVPFTVTDLVQARLGDRALILIGLINLRRKGLVLDQKDSNEEIWVRPAGSGAAVAAEFQDIDEVEVDENTPTDNAFLRTGSDYGGIDLTAIEPTLQIKRDSYGVPLPLPLQNILDIHLDGLKFIILNTAPASFHDFPFLISLKERNLK